MLMHIRQIPGVVTMLIRQQDSPLLLLLNKNMAGAAKRRGRAPLIVPLDQTGIFNSSLHKPIKQGMRGKGF